jgi:hypothetical protein
MNDFFPARDDTPPHLVWALAPPDVDFSSLPPGQVVNAFPGDYGAFLTLPLPSPLHSDPSSAYIPPPFAHDDDADVASVLAVARAFALRHPLRCCDLLLRARPALDVAAPLLRHLLTASNAPLPPRLLTAVAAVAPFADALLAEVAPAAAAAIIRDGVPRADPVRLCHFCARHAELQRLDALLAPLLRLADLSPPLSLNGPLGLWADAASGDVLKRSAGVSAPIQTRDVRRVIERPLLLKGRPFVAEFWAVVTSVAPVCAFVYGDGICYFDRHFGTPRADDTLRGAAPSVCAHSELDSLADAGAPRLHALLKRRAVGAIAHALGGLTKDLQQRRGSFLLVEFAFRFDFAARPWLVAVRVAHDFKSATKTKRLIVTRLLADCLALVDAARNGSNSPPLDGFDAMWEVITPSTTPSKMRDLLRAQGEFRDRVAAHSAAAQIQTAAQRRVLAQDFRRLCAAAVRIEASALRGVLRRRFETRRVFASCLGHVATWAARRNVFLELAAAATLEAAILANGHSLHKRAARAGRVLTCVARSAAQRAKFLVALRATLAIQKVFRGWRVRRVLRVAVAVVGGRAKSRLTIGFLFNYFYYYPVNKRGVIVLRRAASALFARAAFATLRAGAVLAFAAKRSEAGRRFNSHLAATTLSAATSRWLRRADLAAAFAAGVALAARLQAAVATKRWEGVKAAAARLCAQPTALMGRRRLSSLRFAVRDITRAACASAARISVRRLCARAQILNFVRRVFERGGFRNAHAMRVLAESVRGMSARLRYLTVVNFRTAIEQRLTAKRAFFNIAASREAVAALRLRFASALAARRVATLRRVTKAITWTIRFGPITPTAAQGIQRFLRVALAMATVRKLRLRRLEASRMSRGRPRAPAEPRGGRGERRSPRAFKNCRDGTMAVPPLSLLPLSLEREFA